MSKLLVLIISILVAPWQVTHAHEIEFNNGSLLEYSEAASLDGGVREIQLKTKALWPRATQGKPYVIAPHFLQIIEKNDFLIIKSNNLPDHELTTTNPNCARPQNFKFLIPKTPKKLDSPINITKKMQKIGVALNGVVIAGPYDSQNKIAPYNRVIDLCSSHSDPKGLYHYHFAPLCLKDDEAKSPALNFKKQIGWSFDGFKINGLADRNKHLPTIDACNGHSHDGDYHYHVTRDFPFFMGCYTAKPEAINFKQKLQNLGTSSSNCLNGTRGGANIRPRKTQGSDGEVRKKPNFKEASSILNVSEKELKNAFGPPPGNISRAARRLDISESALKAALQFD